MMSRIILLAIILLPVYSISQSSVVTTGIVQFENGNYEQALEKFNQALQDPSALKESARFNAWYYKGKALVQEYAIAVNSGDAEQITQKYEYILIAGTSFLKANEFASSSRL